MLTKHMTTKTDMMVAESVMKKLFSRWLVIFKFICNFVPEKNSLGKPNSFLKRSYTVPVED